MLRDHLVKVAERASAYAEPFGASEEAYLAGILHDLGKYGNLFQRRLEGKEKGIDHWTAGAWAALRDYRNKGIAAALAIQGHHIGLQAASRNNLSMLNIDKYREDQHQGVRLSEDDTDKLMECFLAEGLKGPASGELAPSKYEHASGYHASHMLDVRMLYSTLVDADFIETEAHFGAGNDPESSRQPGLPLQAEKSLEALLDYMRGLPENSEASEAIKRIRNDLFNMCLQAGDLPKGLYTLTAPTGSGKTLAMLAFALKHAVVAGHRRIVFVIPYLSIIDQTAARYREVFSALYGENELDLYMLEHHSMAGTRRDREVAVSSNDYYGGEEEARRHLLTQNWDAPIIVTTSVQFLESLFADRPSACRKLHGLANSVILFDEVQNLPVYLAIPSLAALSRLAQDYGSTIVFSTATQPAFDHLDSIVREGHCSYGWAPREIASLEMGMYSRAKRCEVMWPANLDERTSWRDLALRLEDDGSERALIITNLKRHALELHEELKAYGCEGLFHLSTNMCPAHRRDVLQEVRERLEREERCILVSTQCVEAGVDIDFPVVFRAWAPLDAIAQAAGRCNRNGRQLRGNVHVFVPEDEAYPDGAYRQAAGITRLLFKTLGSKGMDIDNPELFRTYYRDLYELAKPQERKEDLTRAIQERDFVETAKHYRVIERNGINVLVYYKPERFRELKDEVMENGLSRRWMAMARPYAISIFEPSPYDPVKVYLDPVPVGRRTLSEEWYTYLENDHYRPDTGLVLPENSNILIG